MHRELFYSFQAYFFDLDGCVYFGDALAPGATEVIDALKQSGKRVIFVTNNSRSSAKSIVEKLRTMGLETPSADVVTATDCVGTYLSERYGRLSIRVAGSDDLCAALSAAGHIVVSGNEEAAVDAAVIGLDIAFDYRKLEMLGAAVGAGARLIAANADLSHPGLDGGKVPETGALAAAVEAITGLRAEYVGKPEPHLFAYGLERCGARPEECVMIGDNYNTDIVGGRGAGMRTIWLDGRTASERSRTADDYRAADWIVEDLAELRRIMEGLDV